MVAPFELASTWLLERMYTRPKASRTRAPMVPAVIAGCPTEYPIGAGRWRVVGSLNAISRPVTRWVTGIPSRICGRPTRPARSNRSCTPGRPSGSSVTAVPTTPCIWRSASVWWRCAAMAARRSGSTRCGAGSAGAAGDSMRSEHPDTAMPAPMSTIKAARVSVRTLTMGATPGFKTENGRATSMGPGGRPGKPRGVNGITRFWVECQERCGA